MFFIKNRRIKIQSLEQKYPDSTILDVTSKADSPWIKFSPFYPHGNIPVPFSEGYQSMSVEGIWQGLKVFEKADIDMSKFQITSMKNLKRSVRKNGNVLGHRMGVAGKKLLTYRQARYLIYLPAYRWILDNFLSKEILLIKKSISSGKEIIFLDYETNLDIENIERPLSHASLIIRYIEDNWQEFKEVIN